MAIGSFRRCLRDCPIAGATECVTWAFSQVQELGDHEQEVGLALQIDATHSKFRKMCKITEPLFKQGSSRMARNGAGASEQSFEYSRGSQGERRKGAA
jgi:hypothetical protein